MPIQANMPIHCLNNVEDLVRCPIVRKSSVGWNEQRSLSVFAGPTRRLGTSDVEDGAAALPRTQRGQLVQPALNLVLVERSVRAVEDERGPGASRGHFVDLAVPDGGTVDQASGQLIRILQAPKMNQTRFMGSLQVGR